MLGTTLDSQKSVFAQITPAPEKSSSNGNAAAVSSHNVGTHNDNPQGITPSKKTDETTKESESADSSNVNSGQTITAIEQDDEVITTEEHVPDLTNQLVEAITNEVNEVLSDAGIFGP
jgi:hypothetical protein